LLLLAPELITNSSNQTAITVFISNIAVLGIENCLITSLPDLFSSETILRMEDEKLEAIAAESEDIRLERAMLDEKIKDLDKGLQTIGRQASLLPSGMSQY
jgi:hypothetical protein